MCVPWVFNLNNKHSRLVVIAFCLNMPSNILDPVQRYLINNWWILVLRNLHETRTFEEVTTCLKYCFKVENNFLFSSLPCKGNRKGITTLKDRTAGLKQNIHTLW